MSSNYRNKLNRTTAGFTLIEVMIAIMIMAIIVIITSKSVTEATRLKEQLNTETEVNSDLRAGYFLLDRDFSQVFTPLSMMPADFKPLDPYEAPPAAPNNPSGSPTPIPPPTAAEVNQILNGTAFQVTEFWGPVIHSSGVRNSRFVGNPQNLRFVSMSHLRVYAEKKESIFSKISYSIEPSTRNKELFDLIKTEDTDAFRLDENPNSPNVRKVPILTGIKNFKFEYYKAGVKDPIASWDSENQLDTKGLFPESIRVTFQLVDRVNRDIDQQWIFRLEVKPNALPGTL